MMGEVYLFGNTAGHGRVRGQKLLYVNRLTCYIGRHGTLRGAAAQKRNMGDCGGRLRQGDHFVQ